MRFNLSEEQLVQTENELGAKLPHEYLKKVFTRLPNMTTKDDLDELMPWRIEIV